MSEYLSEEEQFERMKSWWDANGTIFIVAIVITIAGIVGFKWYQHNAEQQAQAAAEQYAAYVESEGAARDSAAAALGSEYAGSAYHAFVLFDEADAALSDGDLEAAGSALRTIVDTADDALLSELARVRLAKVLQQLDRSSEALALLEGVRLAGYQAWALEAKGDIHMARGEIELAHQSYSAAVDALQAGDDRPVLVMKRDNAAPFDGEFVELTDSLEAALKEAVDALAQPQDEQAEPDSAEQSETED